MFMRARWFKKAVCSCFILFALLAASSASEGTIYRVVPGEGKGDKKGASWENAMGVVQFRQALVSGDKGEYWLAAGTYTPHDSDAAKSFALSDDIALYGGFAGVETKRSQRDYKKNKTTLSGAIGGDNPSYNVVYASNVGNSAVLDGFTIADGEAYNDSTNFSGGGMYIEQASPTVAHCTFSENKARDYGGGMYISGGSPTVRNCTFSGNTAPGDGNSAGGGGGMYIKNSEAEVTDCTFSGNTAGYNGGGGMYIDNSNNAAVTNCTFSENKAGNSVSNGGSGGGMYITSNSSPEVTNCTFSENTAKTSGGGMYIKDSNPKVTNCTFSENRADGAGGGGMNISGDSSPTVVNCTFSKNTAASGWGHGMFISGNNTKTTTVTNTIFWGTDSAEGQIYDQSSKLAITYSVVDITKFPNQTNTSANPKLGTLADNGGPTKTCTLGEGSSAIHKGLGVGKHWIDGVEIEVPDTDQRGVPRPQPKGGTVDIGAYEREDEPGPKHDPKPYPEPDPKKFDSSGGCATGPSSPWMVALLAPLTPLAVRKRPGRRGR